MDTFADVSGGEVIHSTTQVYFGKLPSPAQSSFVSGSSGIIISTLCLYNMFLNLSFSFTCQEKRILTHVSSVHSNGHHMVAMFNDSWQISLSFHRFSKSCRTSKAHIPSTMIKMNLYISGFGCHWTWCNCLISLHPLGYQSVCQTYPIPPSPVPRETRPLPKLCAALMLRLDSLHWVK